MISILAYVALAVSWAMFSGVTGYMSLAPASFFGVGIYAVALLQKQLPFPLIIVIGGLMAFALAILIGLVTLRLKGIYFAIFTFGLVVLMARVIEYLEAMLFNLHSRHILSVGTPNSLYMMLGLAVVTVLSVYFIRRSRYGLALLSVGGNEEAAAHMGVNTTRVKVLFFAISAIFMGAAGAIAAPIFIYINPGNAFGLVYSFMPILMAVFGGMAQLYGPVIGAVAFGYVEEWLRKELGGSFMLVFGIMLILVILLLPNGIVALGPIVRSKLGWVMQKLRKGGQAEQHANA
jgi:branched-chain amino acid transport system permease protein